MARRRFLIDRIPDEALPRLEPRTSSGTDSEFVMLVRLRDCAPFMETWPPDFDELVAVATRLLLLPVIAGLSYELLKWAGRSDNIVVKVLSLPGLYLQKITTKEPDDRQLEVAIASMKAALDGKPMPDTILGREESAEKTPEAPETEA